MSHFSKSDTDALSSALAALTRADQALAPAALPHLAALAETGHSFHIDLTTSHTLGTPVIIARPAARDLAALTPRQAEVARAVAQGLTNKDIARALGISPATVKDHVHAILNRLSLNRRSAIAAWLHSAQR